MGLLGLAKQLLAGDEGFFIGIFPEIAEDEAAFLIPDLRVHIVAALACLPVTADDLDVRKYAVRQNHVIQWLLQASLSAFPAPKR